MRAQNFCWHDCEHEAGSCKNPTNYFKEREIFQTSKYKNNVFDGFAVLSPPQNLHLGSRLLFAKCVHVSGKMCIGNCLQRALSFPSNFDFMFLSPLPLLLPLPPSSLGNKRRETFFPLDVRTDFSLPSRPAPRSISFSAFSGNRGASKSEKKKFSPRKKEGGENLFWDKISIMRLLHLILYLSFSHFNFLSLRLREIFFSWQLVPCACHGLPNFPFFFSLVSHEFLKKKNLPFFRDSRSSKEYGELGSNLHALFLSSWQNGTNIISFPPVIVFWTALFLRWFHKGRRNTNAVATLGLDRKLIRHSRTLFSLSAAISK